MIKMYGGLILIWVFGALISAQSDLLGDFNNPPPFIDGTTPGGVRINDDLTVCKEVAQVSLYHCCVYATLACDDLAADILGNNTEGQEAIQCSDLVVYDDHTLVLDDQNKIVMAQMLEDVRLSVLDEMMTDDTSSIVLH